MPAEHRCDPAPPDPASPSHALFEAVAGSLTRSSAATLNASHEVLAHYGDTGDTSTQAAVDTLIDHAADALRALSVTLADLSAQVQAQVQD